MLILCVLEPTGTEPTDNKCNNQCNKCVKDKEYKDYYQILCADFDKYLKCQSKCVSSEAKTPFECIKTPTCVKTCESNCKKLWPGEYLRLYMYTRTPFVLRYLVPIKTID